MKKIERVRHLKVWHDHSTILNHSYVNFTINFIFDSASFLTNAKFITKNPSKKSADTPKLVERPQLYILEQSGKQWIQMKILARNLADMKKPRFYRNLTKFQIL